MLQLKNNCKALPLRMISSRRSLIGGHLSIAKVIAIFITTTTLSGHVLAETRSLSSASGERIQKLARETTTTNRQFQTSAAPDPTRDSSAQATQEQSAGQSSTSATLAPRQATPQVTEIPSTAPVPASSSSSSAFPGSSPNAAELSRETREPLTLQAQRNQESESTTRETSPIEQSEEGGPATRGVTRVSVPNNSSVQRTEDIQSDTQRDTQSNGHSENLSAPLQRSGTLISQSVARPDEPIMPVKSEKKPLRQIVVLSNDLKQAEEVRKFLAPNGIGIVSRRKLGNLGLVSSTFRFSEPNTRVSILAMLQDAFPDIDAEENKRFELFASETQEKPKVKKKHALGHILTGIPLPDGCSSAQHIAMIDASVRADLITSSRSTVNTYQVLKDGAPGSTHGTSIASLLLSDDPRFPGVLQGANLSAINVFYPNEDGELETRTDWLINGLDILAGIDPAPSVVNMSFGGAYSALLEKILGALSERFVFVAAAGNSGDEQVFYPAAYDSVIGVGALDGRGRRLALSSYGQHVSLYAPGEDIWTKNANGDGFYAQGSSYAAPFATAALAQWIARGKKAALYLENSSEQQKVSFEGLCEA